ncbi:hypothetical protein EKK58_01995 [Candidatus Dependentiae bacterium]|nr:MAG: hypothetical protein EKK58_01995 [Candidatus Dependentiae bacterium]
MKSLIEEASTIGKAIEKAWERAGKPQSFSIKVFENPEYGFLGITKRYGKIALFFEEAILHDPIKKNTTSAGDFKKNKLPKHQLKNEASVRPKEKHKKEASSFEGKEDTQYIQSIGLQNQKEKNSSMLPGELDHKKEPLKKQHPQYIWTNSMVAHANGIIKQMIHLMGRPDVHFTIQSEHPNLKVIFDGLLVNEPKKEYAFYKHFAHIIITSLRTKFKTEFKHLRLVLSRE